MFNLKYTTLITIAAAGRAPHKLWKLGGSVLWDYMNAGGRQSHMTDIYNIYAHSVIRKPYTLSSSRGGGLLEVE